MAQHHRPRRLFRKLAEAMLLDPACAQAHLTAEEEALIEIPSGFPTILPTARLDSFLYRARRWLYHPQLRGTERRKPRQHGSG